MTDPLSSPDDDAGHKPRTGVLLVNLGTPESPEPRALRRYLAEFLADRRVVELPRALWFPILYGIILPFRAPRSAALYRSIWTGRGSPLACLSEDLAAAVAARCADRTAVARRCAMANRRFPADAGAARTRVGGSWCCRSIRNIRAPPRLGVRCGDRRAGRLATLAGLPDSDYHDDAAWIDAVAG